MQDTGPNITAKASEDDVLEAMPEPGIALVSLNRPQARNGLTLAMLMRLRQVFEGLSTRGDVKAVVLAADGPVFCAGHDLKEITSHRGDADAGLEFFTHTMSTCAAMMQSITACPKPVIAAVHGTATAAGCQLVATCDLAIAAESAKFCTPGVNIGLFCSTPMVALSRNVPRKRAMEMLLLGDLIDARDAADWGLVNRVVANDRVLAEAMEFARRIASKSPLTVAIGKKTFYDQIEQPVSAAYELAARVMVQNLMARDAAEGIGAFVEKRTPEWKGC